MFVDSNQLIDITIYYKKNGHLFVAYPSRIFKKMRFTPEKEERFQKLNIKMRVLTWGMHNELNERAMMDDDVGNRRFNYKIFKEAKLQRLLAEWDAKDNDGNAVKIDQKSIASLSPAIAEAILNGYDDLSTMSEDEEGN